MSPSQTRTQSVFAVAALPVLAIALVTSIGIASAQNPDPVPDAERPRVVDPPAGEPRVTPGPAAIGTVTGTIVDLERATGKLTVVIEGDKKATLMVPKDAVVKLNGKPSNLSQLRINDKVRITVPGATPNIAREIIAARVDPAEPNSEKDVQVVDSLPTGDPQQGDAEAVSGTLGLTVVSSNRAFRSETSQQTLSGASQTIGGTTQGTTGGTNQPIGGTNQGTNQPAGGTNQGTTGGTNQQSIGGTSQTIGGTSTTRQTEQTQTDARESLTIVAVMQGGPGAEAGLRVGDAIVAIDGRRPAASTQQTELIQLLPKKQVGDQVVLDVVRGQNPSRVTLIVEAAQEGTTNEQAPAGGVEGTDSPRTRTQTGAVQPNTGFVPNTGFIPNTGTTGQGTADGSNQGATLDLLAQEINRLRSDLANLKNRVDQLEGRQPVQPPQPQPFQQQQQQQPPQQQQQPQQPQQQGTQGQAPQNQGGQQSAPNRQQ